MPVLTPSTIHRHTLDNGLTILWQSMPWLRTAAYSLWLPGGIASESSGTLTIDEIDDDPRAGLASLTCEMMQRGAGRYSSRELVAAEDNLGIDGSGSASTSCANYSASMPADSLPDSLELLAAVVRQPHLPGDQFEDAKLMLRQEMMASLDEPVQRLMKRLRLRQYGDPLGRSGLANETSLQSLSIDDVRDFYQTCYHAGGAILSVAGNLDGPAMVAKIESLFGDWKTGHWPDEGPPKPTNGYEHIELPSSQTHIGFAFDSIPYGHDDYFVMRAGIGILSDGMSSRLFDRVREQRGLCYSVWASTHSLPGPVDHPGYGSVLGYAGTTPPRAQETLDVTLREIRDVADDLSADELDRWKTRIESSLIMEQESAGSRAGSIASDQFQTGRVTPTEELEEIIQAITLDQVRTYWHDHAPASFRVVTVGPEPLSLTNVCTGESA